MTSRSDSTTVSLRLPAGPGSESSRTAPARTAVFNGINASTYQDVLPQTDAVVEALSDSIRVKMITKSPAAPRRFEFPVAIPAGGSLGLLPDGSAVIKKATQHQGNPLAGSIKAPFATDATGRSVATHFELAGDTLVQVIAPGAGVAYPVTSDPWLGRDLINSARWVYHAGDGWTLEVTPTSWQRFWNGYWPAASGWDELYAKYRNRGLDTNLGGMRDQYICHVQIVSVRAPNKPTWNLDEWRPNVGYWQTINSSCNPGGPRWFD